MKTNYNIRYFVLLLFIQVSLNFSVKVIAQAPTPPKNFASPNVASLGSFVDNVGVNLFTGSPNISLPIYAATEGSITLPISLNYSSSLVKPDFHPGWCGLGWSMSSGGSIKRTLNGDADEMIGGGKRIGFYDRYAKVKNDSNTWFTPNKLIGYAKDNGNGEVESDEFEFSFLNYSGQFKLGHDGKWHVISEDDIQLVFDSQSGFMYNRKDTSAWWAETYRRMPPNIQANWDRYFYRFTLITPDGYRYDFGGYNAVEYSVDYRRALELPIIATSWHLSRITTPQGLKIDLEYQHGPLICTLGTSYYYTKTSNSDSRYMGTNCSTHSDNLSGLPTPAGGFLLFPVYLKAIKTSSYKIDFERSVSNELRYSLYHFGPHGSDNLFWRTYFDDSNDLQWQKLDGIKVRNNDGTLIKEFVFSYNNIPTERLKLLSVQERDKNNIPMAPYLFSYNENKLPLYHSDRADHWQYYNGNTLIQNEAPVEAWIDRFTTARDADSTGSYINSEILSRITYPTKGFVTLEFEPHTYSKMVDKTRVAFKIYGINKFGGGLRIKKISTYTNENAIPIVKEYLYVRNYSGQQNHLELLSSGVLGGGFQYHWPNYVGRDIDNKAYTHTLFSSNSLIAYTENASGSPIGYTEVIEKTQNNGFTKTTYTNFDTEVSGSYPHLDERAITYTDEERGFYSPYTSKAMERGKLAKLEVFNNLNQKVKETSYTYTKSSSDYINAIRLESQNVCSNRATAFGFFGTAYKVYSYSFLLTSETEKIYPTDDPGNEMRALVQTKSYEYNTRKLVKKITALQSDGTALITLNKYPTDYDVLESEDIALWGMAKDTIHIINPIVERQIWKKYKNGTTKIISGDINRYGIYALPASTYQLENIAPSDYGQDINYTGIYTKLFPGNMPYVKKSDIKYDSYGNVIEFSQPGQPVVSFLYSYKHQLPVARITNATNQEIAAALGYPNYYTLSSATGDNYTEEVITKVNSLRTLISKARITSATYTPLIGITSSTDENGKTSYYDYDNFNRIQLIKDNEKNIIQAYRYNYKQ